MNIAVVAVIILVGIVAFFVWANRRTRTIHQGFTVADVEAALENVLSKSDVSHDTWDLFLSWPIKDPFLESIRRECGRISASHSDEPGRDLSVVGEEKVRSLLTELRRRA